MIDSAGGVRRVLPDHQFAFMIQQAVEDMGGLTGIGGYDFGVERREAVGHMSVEEYAGLPPAISASTPTRCNSRPFISTNPIPASRKPKALNLDRKEADISIRLNADILIGRLQTEVR